MNKHCILIVDDEPGVRSSLTRLIQKEGYETVLAENADDAFATLRTRPISIVISDYLMPGRTGLEFLKEVTKTHPETIRIILTGRADVNTVMAAVNEGVVSHFLLKPWDNDVLRKIIRKGVEKFETSQSSKSDSHEKGETDNVDDLEKTYPGISFVKESDEGAIIIDE